ncbi:histone deacetylase family protein [Roseofilum casamattae]|uniref:Histone deacetylase n=1 Tax=Roseofilum casamattae BLCC-M143 TaxID=3022442 RepID=A0ABT7BVC5_9CYAN|nr:histone deacetylase [Roseofilum casamattae]MDJ1183136.1 histone deacetylase [Roseofilum casamattae BLCC-M143]
MLFPIIYSEDFLLHDTGKGHPERPERLRAIVDGLRSSVWAEYLDWQVPTSVEGRPPLLWIERIHTREHIALVRGLASSGGGFLDGDTIVSPHSYDAALLAVNAWLDGVDRVLERENPAFVLARPPGHHALSDRGMGFCLFSNAAIAAHYALEQPGVERVAILDWDVHHGNGTEAIVENHPQIIYCSLHQYPCYPGTGRMRRRKWQENILNIPLTPGSAMDEYWPEFETEAIPFVRDFQPDLLIVSAGYDANQNDRLAGMNLHPEDYGKFTEACLQVTSRILFGLEGGYDLESLSQSAIATVAACLRETAGV